VPVWGTLPPIYAKDVFATGPQGLGCAQWRGRRRHPGRPCRKRARAPGAGAIQAGWIVLMGAAILGLTAGRRSPRRRCGVIGGAARWRTPRATWRCTDERARGNARAHLEPHHALPAMISVGRSWPAALGPSRRARRVGCARRGRDRRHRDPVPSSTLLREMRFR
jgi:hypothetical protein